MPRCWKCSWLLAVASREKTLKSCEIQLCSWVEELKPLLLSKISSPISNFFLRVDRFFYQLC